jgi:hypothetical protein
MNFSKFGFKDNPFSFGGGLLNGGISKEGMNRLREIFSFDYMGSAEFEWGAVPAALQFLAEQRFADKLVANLVDVSPNANEKNIVYYVCPVQYENDVVQRIKELRKIDGLGNRNSSIILKEHCGLKEYFSETGKWSEYAKRNIGWLELDNGFIFFTDKEVFDKFCAFFGIEVKK